MTRDELAAMPHEKLADLAYELHRKNRLAAFAVDGAIKTGVVNLPHLLALLERDR